MRSEMALISAKDSLASIQASGVGAVIYRLPQSYRERNEFGFKENTQVLGLVEMSHEISSHVGGDEQVGLIQGLGGDQVFFQFSVNAWFSFGRVGAASQDDVLIDSFLRQGGL